MHDSRVLRARAAPDPAEALAARVSIAKIENLEFKNSLLTTNLDLDYIEILIRSKFLFGKKDETTYIINNDN